MTSEIDGDTLQPADRGTGFLLWGWIAVAVLNLAMVTVSLAMFAP